MLQKPTEKMSKEGIAITVLLDGDFEQDSEQDVPVHTDATERESLNTTKWNQFTCIMAAGGSMGAAGAALYFTQ